MAEQLKLVPPTSLICPKVQAQGDAPILYLRGVQPLELRNYQHKQWEEMAKKTGLLPDTNMTGDRKEPKDILRTSEPGSYGFPKWLSDKVRTKFEDPAEGLEHIISRMSNDIYRQIKLCPKYRRDERFIRTQTENFVKAVFPGLSAVIGHGGERTFFKGSTVTGYVNEAIKNAKLFKDWAIEQLPKYLRQRLELHGSVNSSTNLVDLLYLAASDQEVTVPKGISQDDILRDLVKLRHDAVTLLQIAFATSVVDLSIRPGEEKILDQFNSDSSEAFRATTDVIFSFTPGENHSFSAWRVSTPDEFNQIQAQGDFSMQKLVFLTFRRFGPNPKDLVLYESRPKRRESATLKELRGRDPTKDLWGIRFVLYDRQTYPRFLALLRAQMSNWDFKEEQIPSKAPESRLDAPIKLFVWHRKKSQRYPIELQVDYLKDGLLLNDTWPEKQWGKKNFEEYRMEKLVEIFKRMYPKEIYGMDWENKEFRSGLFQYAYEQAVGF